jgi:hypothetical protein
MAATQEKLSSTGVMFSAVAGKQRHWFTLYSYYSTEPKSHGDLKRLAVYLGSRFHDDSKLVGYCDSIHSARQLIESYICNEIDSHWHGQVTMH